MLRALLVWIAIAWPLNAEQVVLGLSQEEVAITATFDGSSLLIFGAISRDAPIPPDSQFDVIITVTGPSESVDVRKKDRRFGIWVNAHTVRLGGVPSFYAVAATRALEDIISPETDAAYQISLDHAIRTFEKTEGADDEAFTDALIRIRARETLYQIDQEDQVSLDQETLFRTELTLPANLVEGDYQTRILLVRDGEIVDAYATPIEVRKVGLERWLYNLAHQKPLIYGIMSLTIAIAAGWLASAIFGLLRR